MKPAFKDKRNLVFLMRLAFLAILLRFSFSAAYYHLFIKTLKMPLYALDGEAYSIMGWYIALVLKGINVMALPSIYVPGDYVTIGGLFGTIVNFGGLLPGPGQYGVGLHSYIIGIFYRAFGYAPVLVRFFMGIVSVSTAVIAYFTAKKVFNETTAKITYVFCLFMPSFIFYSSSLQRDTIINFFTLVVISQILVLKNLKGVARLIMTSVAIAVAFGLLYLLRPNVVMILLIFFAAYMFIWFACSYRWLALVSIMVMLVFQPVVRKIEAFAMSKLTLMFSYHIGLNHLGGFSFRLLPEQYYRLLESGSWVGQLILPLPIILTGCAKGLLTFLFEPSPFIFYKLQHIFFLPQILIWYFILIYFFIGIFASFRSLTVEKISLITVAGIFAVTIGISESNYETLLRHKDMIVPVFIMIGAYGMTEVGHIKKV